MNSAIVKRSVSLGGHKTSISLEDAFWNYLKEIAESRGVSVSVIVAEIQAQDRRTNLSSAIRLFVLDHYRTHTAPADESAAVTRDMMGMRTASSVLRAD